MNKYAPVDNAFQKGINTKERTGVDSASGALTLIWIF
jgi:hypothetical protein